MTSHGDYLDERDRLFSKEKLPVGRFQRALGGVARAAMVSVSPMALSSRPRGTRSETLYRSSVLKSDTAQLIITGGQMESTAQMLEATNRELERAKETMQSLVNELKASADIIGPSLMEHVKQMRATRMALASESREAMAALKDVRAFMLDKDYATEVERLDRLVKLCREFKALKESGVLDIVLDSALKLAVGHEG